MSEKETMKEKLANLFDNDDRNSNNIFDRVSRQMKTSSVNEKIDEVIRQGKKDISKAELKKES